MPAVSVTLTLRVLLALRVAPARLHRLWPTVALAACQVVPLSTETYTVSPLASAALRPPLMVWLAVRVTKSLLVAPLGAVSALKLAPVTVVVGALVSMV